MAFNEVQFQFIRVWAKIAGLIKIVIPLAMWIVFWHKPILRLFFSCYLSCYLSVVVVQLASEASLSRILCKSVVVIIGTLYTGFRIWQLWSGLNLVVYSQPWLALLWLVLLFWIANAILLILIAIPSIFPKSDACSLDKKKAD